MDLENGDAICINLTLKFSFCQSTMNGGTRVPEYGFILSLEGIPVLFHSELVRLNSSLILETPKFPKLCKLS